VLCSALLDLMIVAFYFFCTYFNNDSISKI